LLDQRADLLLNLFQQGSGIGDFGNVLLAFRIDLG
jgi:hypothetical protein